MIIWDNHLHLRRDGRCIEAIKDYEKNNGTHLVLCQYPMPEIVLKEKSYKKCYEETLSIADHIRKNTNVKVYVTIGPYPVDYIILKEKLGRSDAINIMKKGMEEASKICTEDVYCIGIGEIGRPHFTVEKEIIDDSNEILSYGMQIAADINKPVILHTESTTTNQCRELVEMGKKAGLRPDKIIKHFSPPLVTHDENYGLMPSIIANRRNILTAIEKGLRFMMETDYIDDPKRPGAVLDPRTIPRLTKKLITDGVLSEKQAYIIHVENPKKTYDIDIE
ncbi:MAG: TatD family hydrolase [Candidatus Thermoplasmatota archaeon]